MKSDWIQAVNENYAFGKKAMSRFSELKKINLRISGRNRNKITREH